MEQQLGSTGARRWRIALVVAAALILLGAAAATLQFYGPGAKAEGDAGTPASAGSASVVLNLPPPDLVRPLTPKEAVEENRKREFVARPDSAAEPFLLRSDAASRERALECLTQAVYYEAAGEGLDGGRAVAQVVLNRMRHPAYPASVCGVVYQGSERATGCQFTFTCDGSLARAPARYLWDQSRKIAAEALAGKVFAGVGHATHYHADYVLPYWADSLDKSAQIGRHIFYRLKGGLGSKSFFRQRYAGSEPLPPPPSVTEVAIEAVERAEELLAGDPRQIDPNLLAPSGDLLAITKTAPDPLVADASAGTLILDGGKAPPKGSGARESEPCSPAQRDKRLRPMAANDVRAGSVAEEC